MLLPRNEYIHIYFKAKSTVATWMSLKHGFFLSFLHLSLSGTVEYAPFILLELKIPSLLFEVLTATHLTNIYLTATV